MSDSLGEELENEALTNEEVHEFGALNTLLMTIVLIICFVVAYLVKKFRFHYLPESASVILMGIVLGYVAQKLHSSRAELDVLSFSPEVFYFGLLPPLIFKAGYTCRRKAFFQNIVPITLFAVVGTFVSTFFIGYATYALGRTGWVEIDVSTPIESLLLGALISAVNPVATLSVMDLIMGSESPGEKCNPLLYSLIFGESVLNDAVAIVLFHSFNQFKNRLAETDGTAEIGWRNSVVVQALTSFVATSIFSVLLGVLVGLACSYFMKNTDIAHHTHLELALLFLFAYGSYALSESLELSGIMSLFICAVVLAHYNSYNLSPQSARTAEITSKTFAQLSEFFIFLYLGMGFGTGRFTRWSPIFIVATILSALTARALFTFPLSALVNLRRDPETQIGFKMQVVIWFSGIRGAIAFALSQQMPEANQDLYVTTTLSVVLFTTVVCGSLTEPVLTATGMRSVEGSGEYSAVPLSSSSGEGLPSDSGGSNGSGSDDEQLVPLVPEVAARHRRQAAQVRKLTWWRVLDEKWIKPTFGGNLERSSDAMPHAHHMGSGHSSSSSGLPQRLARGNNSNSSHGGSSNGSGSSSSPAHGSSGGGSASSGNGSTSGDGKKGSSSGLSVSYSSLPSSANTHLRKQFNGGDDELL